MASTWVRNGVVDAGEAGHHVRPPIALSGVTRGTIQLRAVNDPKVGRDSHVRRSYEMKLRNELGRGHADFVPSVTAIVGVHRAAFGHDADERTIHTICDKIFSVRRGLGLSGVACKDTEPITGSNVINAFLIGVKMPVI